MASEFSDLQLRIWPQMGGPQEKCWARLALFSDYSDEVPEPEPHPETMAALAVLQQFRDSALQSGRPQPPRTEILEHAWAAMALCKVGLKAIPKKHWRPL